MIGVIARTAQMRDAYTAAHQERTANLAAAMAWELRRSEQEIKTVYLAGLVHDVGKMGVPAGYAILKDIEVPWPIAEIVLQHHEWLDGSGYPQGLHADAIVIGAKILAIADAADAMLTHRPYRAALGIDAAVAELEINKGRIYDPAAVDACIALLRRPESLFE